MALLNAELCRSMQQTCLLSRSVVDRLEPIYFSNWAVELDGDESEDVAVIVVYNVAVMSDEHVLVWHQVSGAMPARRLIAVVDSYRSPADR